MSQQSPRLADRLRAHGPLSPDAAAALLLPVADGLGMLHAAGSVHGAVSPAAIGIDETGSAALLVAGRVEVDREFIAPEVLAGATPDRRADVWSFAAVLQRATTGASPYERPAGPRAGGWLRPVTELALARDPRQRPTMADVADYLRARVAPAGGEQQERQERRERPGSRVALVGAAVVSLLALLGGGLLLRGGAGEESAAPPPPSRATTATPAGGPPSAGREPRPASRRPTAAELERFARRYVATASRDPELGYTRLTPAYRAESTRYVEVWTAIEDPEILSLSADPRAMTVRYTYRYSLPDGSRRTEDVTLRLVRRGGRLLIAGASARQL